MAILVADDSDVACVDLLASLAVDPVCLPRGHGLRSCHALNTVALAARVAAFAGGVADLAARHACVIIDIKVVPLTAHKHVAGACFSDAPSEPLGKVAENAVAAFGPTAGETRVEALNAGSGHVVREGTRRTVVRGYAHGLSLDLVEGLETGGAGGGRGAGFAWGLALEAVSAVLVAAGRTGGEALALPQLQRVSARRARRLRPVCAVLTGRVARYPKPHPHRLYRSRPRLRRSSVLDTRRDTTPGTSPSSSFCT